jgi:hypothetical protein
VLGTDFFPGGAPGVGAKKLAEHLAHTRDPPALLRKLNYDPDGVNNLTLGVEAFMFEPVRKADDSLTYLHGAPESLNKLNRHLVLPGVRVDLKGGAWTCARGHRVCSEWLFFECTKCNLWYCQFCARTQERNLPADWACIWCADAPEPAFDAPFPLLTGFTGEITQYMQLLSRYDVEDTSIKAEYLSIASKEQLECFLRGLGVKYSHEQSTEQLRAVAQGTVEGKVIAHVRDDQGGEKEREAARQLVADGTLSAELCYWAYTWPLPDAGETQAFDENFFYTEVAFPKLAFLVKLVARILQRPEQGSAHDMQGLVGPYIAASAIVARPFGGRGRIVRYAVRGAAAAWQPPLTKHQAGFVRRNGQDLLYLKVFKYSRKIE